MGQFSNLGVFRAAASQMLAGITDIVTRVVEGQIQLFTTTRAGGGLLALELTGSGLVLIDQQGLAAGSALSAPSLLSVASVGGQERLVWTGGWGNRMGGWRLEDSGAIATDFAFVQGPVGIVTAQTFVARGGISYAVVAAQGSGALEVWRLNANGRLVAVDQAPMAGAGSQTVDVRALATLDLGGQSLVLSLSTAEEALRLWRLRDDGTLEAQASLGATAGLGLATPSALELVQGYGRAWAVVAGSGSSSISVVEVTAAGDLRLADHIIDTLDTRFQSVQALATVQMGDRVFIFAGGADAGISAFMMLPDGRLIAAGQLLAGPDMALDDITALEAVVVGNKVELVVAGEGAGLIRLRFDPGTLAAQQRGSTGDDTLTGGAQGDLLWGHGGNDRLSGGDGADVLVDGAGSDDLRGGDGADVFVLSRDGAADIIRDFDPSEDRLDLSAWGRIYSVEVLPMAERRGAVVIRWGEEVLTVYSADGRDFSSDVFTSSQLFGLWHVVEPAVVAGRSLRGTSARETLTGGGGDDTLIAVGGGDLFVGGNGRDLVDFGEATAGVVANLSPDGGHPSGSSAGDRLEGIENLSGSRFADVLTGSAGDNRLQGGGGADRLEGGAGNDRLEGGAENDVLSGGSGADRIEGGAGIDWASWSSSSSAVDVDLGRASQLGGDAAGDRLAGIEALLGSRHHDRLAGDSAANSLRGAAGDDLILGSEGHDLLEGDEGNDTLSGGNHNDTLIGGSGSDWALYDGRAAVRVDLSLTTAQNTLGRGSDLLAGIENLKGGWGNDTLSGNGLANILQGDTGTDLLFGGRGTDRLEGGGQNDRLYGGLDHDRLMGGSGNDLLFGGDGNDTLLWEAGNDRHDGGAGIDLLLATGDVALRLNLGTTAAQQTGQGQDSFTSVENVMAGTAADTILGSLADNSFWGMEGHDQLRGASGDDRLYGGAGNDRLWGGKGQDSLYGGAGNDRLSGGKSADRLLGGSGADWLHGGLSDDVLRGGKGVDVASYIGGAAVRVSLTRHVAQDTGQGRDLLLGIEGLEGSGRGDHLSGNRGDNWLSGRAGKDRLSGLAGRDTLMGGSGADIVSGGSGNDWLSGGAGRDRLTGGRGADDFVYSSGRDVITDFNAGQGDRLVLNSEVLRIVRGLSAREIVEDWGEVGRDGVRLDFGRGRVVIVDGIDRLADLHHVIEVI
ncbi:MAG: hypothetical protein JNN06_06830 [Gemmobacter sp.]|uniref:calcium-binding protein n=1 Tax=Gemmobacter sp. TaxID=1898957 RepID=UPI001A5DD5C9|nr:hypothetical protein [Gemmobacter sp.]MBL8561978.1 hypothetical protein [Gemmobacter sp.]